MPSHPCDLPPIEYGSPRNQHRLEYAAFLFLGLIFKVLPFFLIKAFLKVLIFLGKVAFKKRMIHAQASIETRLGVTSQRALEILNKSLFHFGLNCVCQIRPKAFVQADRVHFERMDLLEQQQAEGKGTVVAAMHLGLWEAVPHALKLQNQPLAITVAVQHNPLIDKVINKQRTSEGFHHLLHNRLGIRHTLRYLKKGGSLIILSDVDIGPGGIPIPFLGQAASTSKWPMELALRTDSQLLVGFSYLDDQQELHIKLLSLPEGKNDSLDLGQRMNDAMSQIIQDHPEQWFWMQRRWKTPIQQCRQP